MNSLFECEVIKLLTTAIPLSVGHTLKKVEICLHRFHWCVTRWPTSSPCETSPFTEVSQVSHHGRSCEACETPKVHTELLRVSWLHTCETCEGTFCTYIEKFWGMALDQFCLVRSTRSYGNCFLFVWRIINVGSPEGNRTPIERLGNACSIRWTTRPPL